MQLSTPSMKLNENEKTPTILFLPRSDFADSISELACSLVATFKSNFQSLTIVWPRFTGI